jgi:starvation-inducible outer membrane lipoprotein
MGRKVTVVGEVLGKKTRRLGEVQYPYLLIKSKELHILKLRSGYPVEFSIGIWKTF